MPKLCCEQCGLIFRPRRSQISQRYCSRACKNKAKDVRNHLADKCKTFVRRCKRCGETFMQIGSEYKSSLCSDACRRQIRPTKCKTCKAPLTQDWSRGRIKHYCSRKCTPAQQRLRKGIHCLTCNNHFFPDKLTMYCSDDCRLMGSCKDMATSKYKGIIQRTLTYVDRERNHCYKDIDCRFTKDEFKEWAIPELYKFRKAYPYETPSIDRIDPKGHYEPGNVRIISMDQNTLRSEFFKRTVGLRPDNTHDRNVYNIVRAARIWCDECEITKEEFDTMWSQGVISKI
jgi:hypothetical protein